MRKSFFDFGFFIDGALMKAPTESGLPPAQHDALMRRFPRAAPPPPPAKPETPEIREETHSGMTPEQIAKLTPRQHDELGDRLDNYRAARPRQTRTGLRPHGADEEDTPMRSAGVAMPSGVVQPIITHKDEEGDVDERGRTRMQRHVDDTTLRASDTQGFFRRLAKKHASVGTLTDGNEFMNLAGLAGHQANQIAAEYAKWHEGGKGPLPDLSKYENPVIRRKDGSTWDYRDAFKRMVDLDARAWRNDSQHGSLFGQFLPRHKQSGVDIDDANHEYGIHPSQLWNQIDRMWNDKELFDWETAPKWKRTGQGNPVNKPDLTIRDLKRGLPPSQQLPLVRELLNLGLHHQKLSRLHAEGSDDE